MKIAALLLFLSFHLFGGFDSTSACLHYSKLCTLSETGSKSEFLSNLTSSGKDEFIIENSTTGEKNYQIPEVEDDDEDETEIFTRKNSSPDRYSSFFNIPLSSDCQNGYNTRSYFFKPHTPVVSCLYLAHKVLRI